MVTHESHSWAREIRRLPGGELILTAQQAARRLLARLPGLQTGRSGPLDGWQDVARHGKLENLLLSEHFHDELEFLRRHLDRELLYLSRHSSVAEAARGLLCWEVNPAALGAPRRMATGLALAFRDLWRERGAAFQLLVNAERSFRLDSPAEVRELLNVSPVPRRIAPGAWRQGLLRATTTGELDESVATYWVSCDPELPAPRDLFAGGESPPESCGLFAVRSSRLRYFQVAGGAGKSWSELASVRTEPPGRGS
jgi:hypothetical protein